MFVFNTNIWASKNSSLLRLQDTVGLFAQGQVGACLDWWGTKSICHVVTTVSLCTHVHGEEAQDSSFLLHQAQLTVTE